MFKAIDPEIMKSFDMKIQDLSKVKAGDHVLIVADTETEYEMIIAFANAITKAGAIFTICIQPNMGWDSDNPYALTKPVEAAYLASDLVIAATNSSSASVYGRPSKFRELMAQGKVKMFSVAERDFQIVARDTIDYDIVVNNSEKLMDVLTRGKKLHITSNAGTDIQADTEPASLHHESNQPGFSFLASPEGEVHYGPVYWTFEGKLVIDGPIANICSPYPDQPVEIDVENGRIVSIEGGADARRLKEFLEKIQGFYISEIGFGTNPQWIEPRRLHDFKKFLGNFHVAYGGWWGVQDQDSIIRDRGPDRANEAIPCMIHGDMVILPPATLKIDGKTIIENGQFMI